MLVTEGRVSSDVIQLAPGELSAGEAGVLVGTGNGVLEVMMVHPAGKRAMPAADWYRGLPAGVHLRA